MEATMALVIKTIRGRAYRYQQTSRRVNGKVVTKSVYLGPLHPKRRRGPGLLARVVGFINVNFKHEHVFDMEKLGREELERQHEKAAKSAAALDDLHERYGLTLGPAVPVPVEKPVRDDAVTAARDTEPSEVSSADQGDAAAKS
jgi:hypothetical protein